MTSTNEEIRGKLDRVDETKEQLRDAQYEVREAEASLRTAIISDVYLCDYVMTVSYPKLRKAIKHWS